MGLRYWQQDEPAILATRWSAFTFYPNISKRHANIKTISASDHQIWIAKAFRYQQVDKSWCKVFSYQGTKQNKGNLDLYQLVVNSEDVLSENGYHRQAQMAWRCIQSRTFTATLQNGEHTCIKRVALQILSSSNDGAKLTNKAAREWCWILHTKPQKLKGLSSLALSVKGVKVQRQIPFQKIVSGKEDGNGLSRKQLKPAVLPSSAVQV